MTATDELATLADSILSLTGKMPTYPEPEGEWARGLIKCILMHLQSE